MRLTFLIAKQYREEDMRKAIAGAITLTTLTVAIQSIAQTPPPAPIMPPSLPAAHVVNLMTNEGSGAFGVQWRVADVRIVEVPAAINKDRYKTTYQIEPRAMPTDFDDSQWERIEGKDLGVRRSGGHTAFMWFRGLLTMPARIGDFDLSKPAVAVLNVLVDDYAEVWINGQMPRRSGYPSPLPFRASTCPIAWCLAPKSRPATDSSSQCLRLTDQCLIRSQAFGFAKPWWSFIVDE